MPERDTMNEENNERVYMIYVQATKQFVEVSEEVFRAFYKNCTRERKTLMAAGYCHCPQSCIFYCNCDCQNCNFRATPIIPTSPKMSDDEDAETHDIPDPIDIEIEMDSHLLVELIEKLAEIYPDAETIIKLRYAGHSDREIARIIDTPRSTYLNRLQAALKKLGVTFDDFK